MTAAASIIGTDLNPSPNQPLGLSNHAPGGIPCLPSGTQHSEFHLFASCTSDTSACFLQRGGPSCDSHHVPACSSPARLCTRCLSLAAALRGGFGISRRRMPMWSSEAEDLPGAQTQEPRPGCIPRLSSRATNMPPRPFFPQFLSASPSSWVGKGWSEE